MGKKQTKGKNAGNQIDIRNIREGDVVFIAYRHGDFTDFPSGVYVPLEKDRFRLYRYRYDLYKNRLECASPGKIIYEKSRIVGILKMLKGQDIKKFLKSR